MITISVDKFLLIILAFMFFSAFVSAGLMFLGAWVMFKGKATQGEGFIREPKGDVFRIPDETEDFPGGEAEKSIIGKTNNFLKQFTGGE